MDVKEVEAKKELLRQSITKLIDEFEEETQTYVSFLNLDKPQRLGIKPWSNHVKVAVFIGDWHEV